MKLFISWSGDRSQALAKALHEWIPLVLHYVEPWMSKSDIDAGDRWANQLGKQLEGCAFGVSCITHENPTAPWLLFEAGALAKQVEATKLVPLLLDHDLKDFSGPLSQFQAKKVDQNGILELVQSLNKEAASAVTDARLQQLFEMAWPNLSQKVDDIPASTTATTSKRPQDEILEELVSGVRSVEARVRDFYDDDLSIRRRSKRRRMPFPPMVMEMGHEIGRGRQDPIQLLIFAGIFRDELPWLYEMAVECYHGLRGNDSRKAHNSLARFKRAVQVLERGPYSHELGLDSDFFHMMAHDLLHSVNALQVKVTPVRLKKLTATEAETTAEASEL